MMRGVKSTAERESIRRDRLARLLARIDSDVARLRIGGEDIATITDSLKAARERIADYLAECSPSQDMRRRAAAARK